MGLAKVGARADPIASDHVLEHVDDRRALTEIYRSLADGGQLIAMVPIIEDRTGIDEDRSKPSKEDCLPA